MTDLVLPLQARGLTRRFGLLKAVDGLDLEVRPGEVLGFLGPNGAGKTTTLRLCSGLLRPHAGDVRICGHSLAHDPMAARARFGLVPDRPFLYERLTAREMVELIAALYGVPAAAALERAGEVFERLALGGSADAAIGTCSLGARQKIALAVALVHDPPLLMLDEPLTGLDPRAGRALKDLLRERAGRGHGVLISTHLMEVAERLCDRVVILHRGRRRAEGSLAELRGARADASLEEVFLELTAEDWETT